MTAESALLVRPQVGATIRAYVALTKPKVITLLLVTTVPAMVVAGRGWPGSWLVLWTLVGGALSAGGANAINCWYDRDIDGLMRRTRTRPVVTGAVTPGHALSFGVALGIIAFVLLWVATTPEAALLSLAALLFYVFVYTIWLKRRTDQNIVIGGAAGAFPPAVGWAAVNGDVAAGSIMMFAIIFFWTPPHFWALSLRLADDYGRAGVPMMPVVRGVAATRRQILAYTVVLVPVTLALVPAADLGLIYAASGLVLSALFVIGALRLMQDRIAPIALYKFSLLHLGLLFVAMGVDAAVLG